MNSYAIRPLAGILFALCATNIFGEDIGSLDDARRAGIASSRLTKRQEPSDTAEQPRPRLELFNRKIAPILRDACTDCHGADEQEGNVRIDTLDPDLVHGQDVDWWLEVLSAISKREMPPESGNLDDSERATIVGFLTRELQIASRVRRNEQAVTSFRRLTRYEYNYMLQDLLGLPLNLAADLPPETASGDGFQNSSHTLHMSATQFTMYRDIARSALEIATVRGPRPSELHWRVTMTGAAEKQIKINNSEERRQAALRRAEGKELPEPPKQLRRPSGPHYWNPSTQHGIKATWRYRKALYAWEPDDSAKSNSTEVEPESKYVAILPAMQRINIELGNMIPDAGYMRIRVRACKTSNAPQAAASLRWEFGFQASNNSSALVPISYEVPVSAPPDAPEVYEWLVPLEDVRIRNPMRKTARMGATPNPSEYLRLQNAAASHGEVQIEWVEVDAPIYESWPPKSHSKIFVRDALEDEEGQYAAEILSAFMPRAWRRPIDDQELEQKLALFGKLRPTCSDFQQAIVEVLAAVLASPNFLYVAPTVRNGSHDDYALATRLSLMLWCSMPDDELRQVAREGRLRESRVLAEQTQRMLADERSKRFSQQFVRQWLSMQLLDYLKVDKDTYPHFGSDLRDAMQREPVELFREVLRTDSSVLDFLHSDYAMVNERLALHYSIPNIYGNEFRRVSLPQTLNRGGLLAQAGLLAMNSDGKDSHPLKRGIWVLERLLNDPPPPPPPAVPEIDLADPRIAEMTLKERIEDHRNDPACYSCHAKIDPWGIAFENFDATGSWRTDIDGKPVDASSALPSQQRLEGIEGLKNFLLRERQDQFVLALTHKLCTFALGRPLVFRDRAEVEQIAAELRRSGDGLSTLVRLIVQSDLFLEN